MRLTLVTETFPPEINGVARTLGRWAETFCARGHEVRVIRPVQPGERPAAELVRSVALPFYPEVRIGLATPGRLRRLLKQASPDLVHIATEGPLGFVALQAAQRLRIVTATSFHTNFDHYVGHYGFQLFGGLARRYLRWFHNRTAVTLVPSEGTRNRLLSLGFERVEIWSRGVDGQRFHPRYRDEKLRRSLGLRREDPLLVYVGRLAPEKNLMALIEAFDRLRQRLRESDRERLKLALVGGGPLSAPLRERQTAGVILAGMQQGEDLARWYASGDIFAFPSQSETFGNVVLEAQASGLAVVAYDAPGVNEQVKHGETGLLVPSHGDLAGALLQLCRNHEECRQMGVAARQRAERQDWGSIFDGLERRYMDLNTSARRR